MAKPDFRKALRAEAVKVQDENLARFLASQKVNGAPVEPRAISFVDARERDKNTLIAHGYSPEEAEKVLGRPKGRAKRVRINGLRVSLKELQGKVGIQTGEMLKDITRRSNIRVTRYSFKIVPSPDQRAKWFAFQAGTKRQPPRPTSGMTDLQIAQSRDVIAKEARDQFVKIANSRRRG